MALLEHQHHHLAPDWNILTALVYFNKFWYGPVTQRLKLTGTGDLLTFPLAAYAGLNLWVLVKCLNNFWIDYHIYKI